MNSDLVGCFGSCRIIQALLDGLTPLLILQTGVHKGDMAWTEEERGGDVVVVEDQVLTGESECDDEKVNEGDGGEVNGFEEQISWPQHTLVVLEIVEMVQKEWNGGHEVVEVEMEGQQGPKLVVGPELEGEDETEWELIPVQVVGDA
eukprot:s2236_g8.t1